MVVVLSGSLHRSVHVHRLLKQRLQVPEQLLLLPQLLMQIVALEGREAQVQVQSLALAMPRRREEVQTYSQQCQRQQRWWLQASVRLLVARVVAPAFL